MKVFIVVVSAMAALPLLAPSIGFAYPTHPNEIGLYTTSDGYGATGTNEVGVPVDVYLVLTKPTDVVNGDVPYGYIVAFDCRIYFDPVPNNNLFVLATILPTGSFNIGRFTDINEGLLEFVVATADPAPVTDESVVLVEFSFLNTNNDITQVTLGPIPDSQPPDEMVFLGGEPPHYIEDIHTMHPVSGSHEAPVFIFNGAAVPVENESFGSVKALYR